jgi:alpha-tubulin suppressor-like RCC1 family protein
LQIFTGPMACHTVCVTEDGRTFTFGRNENGQLGLGDCQNRDAPTLVKGLDGVRIVHVACGKTHTLFLSSGGEVWSVGSNKFGELGLGKTSSQPVDKPQKVSSFASKVVDISAGVEFSAAVTEDGRVFTFGHPEFGVLGHGTDGKYIISTAKEGFREVSTPQHVAAWHVSDSRAKDYLGAAAEPPTIKRVFCGNKHTLAVDADGGLWAWGNNGYGRLGLNDPHDRKRPCKVAFFEGPHAIKDAALVTAGGATSGAVDAMGQLYTWGQVKKIGESQIKPTFEQNLSGWRIRSLSFGNESFAVSCDANREQRRGWVPGCESAPHVITWGQSKYGELGYGGSKKSSANPDLVPAFKDTVAVKQICCGMGHLAYLVDADAPAFPEYEPPEHDPKPAGKRAAPAGKAPAAKKGKAKK